MDSCIFCKIIEGTIPSKKVFSSDTLFAFHDIKPQAPLHVLIIPRLHIPSLNDIDITHQALLGDMIITAKTIAQDFKISEQGYRLAFNCGKDGGQDVYHIHLHLLGGRPMKWPPG